MRDIIQGRLMEEKFEYIKGKSEAINRRRTDNAIPKIKRTNNDLQNTTQKTKDRGVRTQLETGGELMCFGGASGSCSTCGTRRVTLVTNLVISHVCTNLRFKCLYNKQI